MKKYLLSLSAAALPAIALADAFGTNPPSQGGGGIVDTVGTTVFRLANLVSQLVNFLTPVAVGIALLAFFYGLIMYLFDKNHDIKTSRNYMIAGIVALFIMVSIWGIIQFFGNTLGISTGGHADIPCAVDRTPGDPSSC